MVCPKCGTESIPGAKFCSECAAPLALICPGCGTANGSSAKFCSECATPLTNGSVRAPGAAATAATPPVAERRLVSVLFADLVGFTPFAEERDAEEVREVLTRYFDISRETIERYGGTIEKFIGDAVMAVWGTPTAQEDDAERAVRAAMDLTDAVRVLGDGVEARAGVLTGEVAVTLGATGQGMVAGDIVNTAARLQSVAEPGTVLVGDSTMRASSAAIVFEDLGAPSLKGKTSPVPAYRALRVVAERGGRNRSGGLEAPFVGRDEELRQLKDAFHAVSRERRPRLMSIVGPAGIGKSRLAWEFVKYIDGVLEPVWWHSGRCPAYGEGITFWALGEMIRTRANLAETDDEAITRSRITEMLVEHVPDEAERRWMEPAMLTLLGIGEHAAGSEQLFAAWRTFFERMAVTSPVVLVFEDLHWADSGLLDFIDHVLEWTRDLPIYLVTLARPELLEKRPNWGAGKRQFSSLFLEALPEADMRDLLSGLVPGLPESALRSIVDRADGVPLYAVETVRMLVAEGRLEERAGVYVPVGELGELAVPETLTALIASRLDALDPEDRTLVQDAAVLGQSFTPEALAAVSSTDAVELEPRLRGLVRRELLVLKADPRAPDRGQYAFVQSLIREVAYRTLARKDRKVRHLAAARFFESLETDELAGALAGHYLAAHENASEGPESNALAVQARIALKGAAERAATLGVPEQASSLLRQALTVTEDPLDRADLLERAGEAAGDAGRHQEGIAAYLQAADLYRGAGERLAAIRATTGQARTMLDAYQTDLALTLLESATGEFADIKAPTELIALTGQLARAYFLAEQPDRAIAAADSVLAAAEHADDALTIADTLVTKGSSMADLGRVREGLALIRAGGQLAEEANLPRTALRATLNAGMVDMFADPRASLESTRAGLALARRLGQFSLATIFVGNAAFQALRVGEWDWAQGELQEALDEEHDRTHTSVLLTELVVIRSARGDPEPYLRLEALGTDGLDAQNLANVDAARGWHAMLDGRMADAVAAFRKGAADSATNAPNSLAVAARAALWSHDAAGATEALHGIEEIGIHGRAIDNDRMTIRAGLAALDGRHGEAITLYREGLRTWRELGLRWDEALTGIDMATLLPPAIPEVAEAAAAARQILTDLSATAVLKRLEAAIAPDPASDAEPSEERHSERGAIGSQAG